MKSLSSFKPVMDALAKVAGESSISHDNGTVGKEYLCHYWGYEEMYDKKRAEVEKDIVHNLMAGKLDDVAKLKKELDALPPTKVVMTFKLLTPIKRLNGTKISYADKKSYSPTMENVEFINIPQDAIDLELCEFEETPTKMMDKLGEEAVVIKLILKKGMIDVKEAQFDLNRNMVRAARANVTPISYRSMQIAGKILGTEESKRRTTYGMTEI